jgi:hypothetical protein
MQRLLRCASNTYLSTYWVYVDFGVFARPEDFGVTTAYCPTSPHPRCEHTTRKAEEKATKQASRQEGLSYVGCVGILCSYSITG